MLPITYYLVTNNLLKNAILLPITYYFEGIIKEYIREAEEPKRLFGLQYKCFYSLYILTIHIQTSILGGAVDTRGIFNTGLSFNDGFSFNTKDLCISSSQIDSRCIGSHYIGPSSPSFAGRARNSLNVFYVNTGELISGDNNT
jgi:hypothetical protein